MTKRTTFGRRSVVAAAAGALVGALVRPDVPAASALSGTGDQQPLILGSNPVSTAAGAPSTPNISSVATTVQASPNFGNFTGTRPNAVFQIDARPAGTATVIGLEVFGTGTAAAIEATGSLTNIQSRGVLASGTLTGVTGLGTNFGVSGQAMGDPSTNVYGIVAGVFGSSNQYGGFFGGDSAPLALSAALTAGAPTGTHYRGELYVDANGKLYCCTAPGTPGTWIELTRAAGPVLNTLPTPERFVDTRSGLGGVPGPLPGGTTKTFQMSGRAGETGNPALVIPDSATALVGNLTVIGGAAISVGSYVTLWPTGARPAVSNINVGPGGVVANSFLVGTGVVGGHRTVNVFNAQECHYILDVSAYYT